MRMTRTLEIREFRTSYENMYEVTLPGGDQYFVGAVSIIGDEAIEVFAEDGGTRLDYPVGSEFRATKHEERNCRPGERTSGFVEVVVRNP